MSPKIEDLETLARQAGEIVRAGYGQRLQVDYKGTIDLVTEIDRRSEAFLLDEIRRRFPLHGIVAEESGEVQGQACCQWYIDPLDGTVNYAHGIPLFAVSLGYVEDGELTLGVVYDPVHDECFRAARGQGAWLNGQRLQTSVKEELDHSLLVTGFPYDIRTNPDHNLDHYAAFALRSLGVRRLGSAALDLCYVAAGRIDGYWELSLFPWDLAAGALIAREAGAKVTNLQGGAAIMQPPYGLVVANPSLHAQMLQVLERNGDGKR